MITSVFGKSKPINFMLCVGILLAYFVMHLFSEDKELGVSMLTVEVPSVFLLLFSLFMVDFIVKKNDFTQQNDFALLIFTIFIGLFPTIFAHIEIVCMLVLVLLAFRRIISLRSLHSVKQKLFDASLYITLAILLDSWMILYLFIIYVAILIYVSNDYRNWLVPMVGFLGTVCMYVLYLYLTDESILTNPLFEYDVKITYSMTDYRRIMLHLLIISLFSINFVIFFLKFKTYSSQKKLSFLLNIILFFIGVTYVLFVKNNTHNTEILLLFPLAISMANLLENIENKRISDILLFLLMIVSFIFNIYLK
ncbi:hypothetical protein H2O64_11575 [Kordia sp. YSTF-M3]|uniref:Beta-carotene 15,15'-monooxygenase n=1 Tax=Kordia aestuariivivens TaxID=2759037 RepID=A0ABR7QA98_9FLAO|nr:DUF6427 family protein [Kordia aestuariivivens]MBC8755318.1 hypothetical protein [Kordia aestuariivivens]